MSTVTGEIYAIIENLNERVQVNISRTDITNIYIALARQAVKNDDQAEAFSKTLTHLSKALAKTNY